MKAARFLVPVLLLLALGTWEYFRANGRVGIFSGTIEADDAQLASRAGGRVMALLVEEGTELTNGQLIAHLAADELAARRTYTAAVIAELEAGPRPEEIESARLQWRALDAELAQARLDAQRKEDLFRRRTVSESERDDAVARRNTLDQQAAAAEQRYRELAAGTRPEKLIQARAQRDEVEALWRELEIRSPGAARLENWHVKVGDVAAPHAPVATIVYAGSPWVRVFVPETWLGRIQVGSSAWVGVDAFPGVVFTGRVAQINRKAEFTPRNVQTVEERIKQVFGVKILLPSDERLRTGMYADARFAPP